MNKKEINDLILKIKSCYKNFMTKKKTNESFRSDGKKFVTESVVIDEDKYKIWCDILKDFEYSYCLKNVYEHITNVPYEPNIYEIVNIKKENIDIKKIKLLNNFRQKIVNDFYYYDIEGAKQYIKEKSEIIFNAIFIDRIVSYKEFCNLEDKEIDYKVIIYGKKINKNTKRVEEKI